MTQLTYLEAIDATNVGTATVLQYLCPIGVLAYYSLVRPRVAPTVSEIFSMILAIAGDLSHCNPWSTKSISHHSKGLVWGLVLYCLYPLHYSAIQLIQKWGNILVIGIGMLDQDL